MVEEKDWMSAWSMPGGGDDLKVADAVNSVAISSSGWSQAFSSIV